MEWEGTAVRVAFHSPFILLFDARFIEIRHVQTGRLAQIIPGTDIRCVWDGRGVNNSQAPPSALANRDDQQQQEAQVHFVMNTIESAPSGGSMRTKNIVQHVCELVPTVALYPLSAQTATPVAPGTPSTYPGAPVGPAQSFTPSHVQPYRGEGSFPSAYSHSPPPRSADIRSTHSWRS